MAGLHCKHAFLSAKPVHILYKVLHCIEGVIFKILKKVNLIILLLIVHSGRANQNKEPRVRMHMLLGPLHGKLIAIALLLFLE